MLYIGGYIKVKSLETHTLQPDKSGLGGGQPTQDELPAIREEKQARPFYPEVEAEKPFTSREKDLIDNALQRRPVSFLDGELHELATGGYIYPERVEYVEGEAKALETGKEPGLSSMLSIKNTGNGSKQQ